MTYEARTAMGRLIAPVMIAFLRRVVAPRFMRQIRALAESDSAEKHEISTSADN